MQTMKRSAAPFPASRSLGAWVPGAWFLGAALLATASQAVPEEATEEADQPATTRIEERLDVEDSAPYIPTSNTIAAKLPIEQAWTPANIGAVSARLMTEQHADTVGDALENVSGVNVQIVLGRLRLLRRARLRLGERAASILTDGAPEPESDLLPDVHDAERVEVFKGPAGFLYGSNPLAGAVNIVRKQPVPVDFATWSASPAWAASARLRGRAWTSTRPPPDDGDLQASDSTATIARATATAIARDQRRSPPFNPALTWRPRRA